MSTNPYLGLPSDRFWRRAAPNWRAGLYDEIYIPRFPVDKTTRIATAGSCFAQHIARHLKLRGFSFIDYELAPPALDEAEHQKYGYGLFSCRYGNIYTSKQLLQLVQRAFGSFVAEGIWEKDGRFYDMFRPSVEPKGFGSKLELLAIRDFHLRSVRKMFLDADVFVYTLGLTELWYDLEEGIAYQTCPGTVAGEFDPKKHVFKNLTVSDTISEIGQALTWLRKINPRLRFILTVSPVPLMATASVNNVISATVYSKSVLRAAAGELSETYDFVDYFPSFEIISSTVTGGRYFASDMRSITEEGISSVMECFFGSRGFLETASTAVAVERPDDVATPPRQAEIRKEITAMCDEEALDPATAA